MTTCPVCGQVWAVAQPASCLCGYEFTSGDPSVAIARYVAEKRSGHRWWLRGLGTLAFLPLTVSLIGAGLAGWLVVIAHVALGGAAFVGGIVRVGRTTRRLKAARELQQLPAARVVMD